MYVADKPAKVFATPLVSMDIRPFRNWHEWLEKWRLATTLEERLGLLHVGLEVPTISRVWGEPEYTQIDQYLFYLTIADGWERSYRNLVAPGDENQELRYGRDENGHAGLRKPYELRQILASKAFSMLSTTLFKTPLGNRRDNFGHEFGELVRSELMPALMHFFRAEAEFKLCYQIRNLQRGENISHSSKEAAKFLLNMQDFLWWWSAQDTQHLKDERKKEAENRNQRMEAQIKLAKIWMVEVLHYLGHLNVLEDLILVLEPYCTSKLREIAMRSEIDDKAKGFSGRKRGVRSLEEAVYAGSSAAILLNRIEAARRVHERIKGLEKAREVRDRANSRIKSLK